MATDRGDPHKNSSPEEDHQNELSEAQDLLKNYSVLAKGSALIILGTVFGFGINFLIRLVPARVLGPDQYGLVILGLTIAGALSIFSKLGLPTGVARNLPRFKDKDKRGLVFSAFTLSLASSILIGAGLFFISTWLAEVIFHDIRLSLIFKIFSLSIPLITLQGIAIGVFQGSKRAKERVVVKNLLNPGAKFAAISLAFLFGYGAAGISTAILLGTALATAYALFTFRSLPFLKKSKFEPHYGFLLKFSLPLLVSSAMWTLLLQADNVLIGYFLSSAETGVYDAAFNLAWIVTFSVSSFGFMFLPIFSELHRDGKEEHMRSMYSLVAKWMVIFTLPIYLALVISPEKTLILLFGSGYADGAVSLVILATGFLIQVVAGPAGGAVVSMGYTRFVMYTTLLAGAMNIVLNVLLIPIFSASGAALASASTYLLFNGLYLYKLNAESEILPRYDFKMPLALASTSFVVISYAGLHIIPSYLPLISLIAAGGYIIVMLVSGGLSRREIQIIRSIIKSKLS